MYQALLTRKYLTSKIMPLLAMAAVMLSVATVLVTWAVMGGFLAELLRSGRTLIGDVLIQWPNTGFPYYEDLITRLEEDPAVEAACPQIDTAAMVVLPDDQVHLLSVKGVDGPRLARVTNFEEAIWWRSKAEPEPKDRRERRDPRLSTDPFWGDWDERYDQGLSLTESDGSAAAILGIEVTGYNIRTGAGVYVPGSPLRAARSGQAEPVLVFMPDGEITMHVMPLDNRGRGVDITTRRVPVVNEFASGIYEFDSRSVYLRLDMLQRMLKMDEAERVDAEGATRLSFDPVTGEPLLPEPAVLGVDPARVTTVLVRGASAEGNANLQALKARVEEIYADFAADHEGEVPEPGSIQIRTWREMNRTMIAAVEKETGLVLFIFGLVCFTTVFLVLAIFWSMVSEKTRDIGILRALGAGSWGVSWLWLRYGTAIGVVGAAAGVAAAAVVVANINGIHDWLGAEFGPWLSATLTAASRLVGGPPVEINLLIWDPTVYYFVRIPSDLDAGKAVFVGVAGVITCVLGATLPALRAARLDPVKALRFE